MQQSQAFQMSICSADTLLTSNTRAEVFRKHNLMQTLISLATQLRFVPLKCIYLISSISTDFLFTSGLERKTLFSFSGRSISMVPLCYICFYSASYCRSPKSRKTLSNYGERQITKIKRSTLLVLLSRT